MQPVRLKEKVPYSLIVVRERPEQFNTVENERGRYSTTRSYFEGLRKLNQEAIQAAETTPKDRRFAEIIDQQFEQVMGALDDGDVKPAREWLAGALRRDAKHIQNGTDELRPGMQGEMIREKAKCLDELDGPISQRTERAIRTEAEIETIRFGRAENSTDPEQMEASSLERVLAEVKTSEALIRQALNEVEAMRKRLEGLIKQAALDKIKRSIESN